jgi:hypothetical protein
MNREQAKQLLPIIQAFAEGKTIQYRHGDVDWVDVAPYSVLDFNDDTSKYRIKPESKYRPFANAEECWQEMQKHQPFGWLKIDDWYCTIKEIRPTCTFCHGGGDVFYYADMVKKINFADGTPFGIKEEE